MLIFRRSSRTVALSLLACIAFIGAAILAWGVPSSDVAYFLLLSFSLLVILIVAAAVFIGLLKLSRRLLARFRN